MMMVVVVYSFLSRRNVVTSEVTTDNGHRLQSTTSNTALTVREINVKTCTVEISVQVIRPDCDTNPGTYR